jgi:decaprenylphospho-beta-D-erythro-pentofuranosid-2-ulose 2-reductase
VLFAEAFAGHMQKANSGTLAIISSVAGDRGRKSNYVYGAAKGLVTRYTQGLQHRLAGTDVKVVLIKPGPTDTPMTVHLKQQGSRLASVEDVAARIVEGIDQAKSLVYAPAKWALIMMIIRHLPNFIFKKLDI